MPTANPLRDAGVTSASPEEQALVRGITFWPATIRTTMNVVSRDAM
ncbi:MAG TPA: hypothetical protein VE505_20705 [Vicinamibacterales bacterium]|nr:hypothetical protein [Vicinamibacterales bacterium]